MTNKLALITGMLGTLAVVLLTVVGGANFPNYSHASQFISELGATGRAERSHHQSGRLLAGRSPHQRLRLFAWRSLPRSGPTAFGMAGLALFSLGYLVAAVTWELGQPNLVSNMWRVLNMNTKADTKEHLEAIVGENLSEEAVQLVQVTQSVASTTDSAGMSAKRNLVFEQKTCRHSRLLDVSGFAQTLSNGQNVLHLTRFICLPVSQTLTFVHPITVVATPLSSKSCFLTISRSLVNNGADVEIKVFSWDANGTLAANIPFDWRCRVELLSPPIL